MKAQYAKKRPKCIKKINSICKSKLTEKSAQLQPPNYKIFLCYYRYYKLLLFPLSVLYNFCSVCKSVGLHMKVRDMSLPIF